ncbi:MAG TPA: hypothetical protein VJ343_00600 [archaeon]|nr:hypothetical protein [archaeon]
MADFMSQEEIVQTVISISSSYPAKEINVIRYFLACPHHKEILESRKLEEKCRSCNDRRGECKYLQEYPLSELEKLLEMGYSIRRKPRFPRIPENQLI